MGDGACYSLIEFIQGNNGLFAEGGMGPLAGGSTGNFFSILPWIKLPYFVTRDAILTSSPTAGLFRKSFLGLNVF